MGARVQMGSFFVMQGALMDREVGKGGFTIPAASLALFNTLGIIILIPLYDRLVVLLRHFGIKISVLQRIGAPFPPPSRLASYQRPRAFLIKKTFHKTWGGILLFERCSSLNRLDVSITQCFECAK